MSIPFYQSEPLLDDQIRELITISRDTSRTDEERKDARDRIVLANTRLAYRIAIRSLSYKRSFVFNKDDLASYGITGIYRAIELFDLDHETCFCTYVYRWIRQAIGYARESNENLITRPHKHRWIEGEINRMTRNGATAEETCKALKISRSFRGLVLKSRVKIVWNEFDIADSRQEPDDGAVEPTAQSRLLWLAIGRLNPKDQILIKQRLGGKLLRELGEEQGVSKECIRHRLMRVTREIEEHVRELA